MATLKTPASPAVSRGAALLLDHGVGGGRGSDNELYTYRHTRLLMLHSCGGSVGVIRQKIGDVQTHLVSSQLASRR